MQHVGQQQREGLVTDDIACAPDRMAEAERALLTRKACLAGVGQVGVERLQLRFLPALVEGPLKLELAVEMVLDNTLVATGDEDEMFDAGGPRLVDHVLDDGAIDDGQHLFRHRFRGGQEAGTEASHGKDGFADAFLGRRH